MNHAITNLTAHVPRHAFTTADVVPELQAEAWQSIVPFFSIEPRRSRELGYLGRITAWNLGSLVLARATSQASVFTRDDRLLRADGFDHWTLLAPSSGTIVADAAVAGAGGCQARALHSVDHGSNSDIDALFLVVPRDLCHPHASELDRLHGANLPAGPGRLLVDYLRSLYRQLPLLDLDQLPMLVDATRNMVIACAAPSRNAMEQAMPAIQATQMERAKQFIRDNLLQASLDTRELCRYLGMSRSSLYRLFEPLYSIGAATGCAPGPVNGERYPAGLRDRTRAGLRRPLRVQPGVQAPVRLQPHRSTLRVGSGAAPPQGAGRRCIQSGRSDQTDLLAPSAILPGCAEDLPEPERPAISLLQTPSMTP